MTRVITMSRPPSYEELYPAPAPAPAVETAVLGPGSRIPQRYRDTFHSEPPPSATFFTR